VVKTLFLLPWQTAPAAENMALDWLLLENFPEPDSVRLRFYGWAKPAFTFGYGQKWAEARAASDSSAELVRRPTGGGLVDHRHDWTYALVIPASHPLAQARACESYRVVHEALSAVLNEAGVKNHLQANCTAPDKNKFSVCFRQPERFDLVRSDNNQKIAGAAQRRTRKGLLLQGTVNRLLAATVTDWGKFGNQFALHLEGVLNVKIQPWDQPSWPSPGIKAEAVFFFISPEWLERR
jgi:lipoate-protein ligase A